MTGIVKFFNDEKGYGFIISDSTKEEYFVHYSQIVMDGYKTLKEGDYVTFNLVETPKGLQAKNVETTRKCMVN